MTTADRPPFLSPREHAALMNAAKRQAHELRDQAIHELWAALDRRVLASWRSMRQRLASLRATEPAAAARAAGLPPPGHSSC